MSAATVTGRLASFVAGLSASRVPEAIFERAKVIVLHDLGVALAGHRLVDAAFSVARSSGETRPGQGARLLVDGTHVGVGAAAFANAALVHARTQDDTQAAALTHLGCTTLPAILALADRDDHDGADFLLAMIAGYEVASEVGRACMVGSTARGFRASSVYGPLGAAAACAKLLGLDAERTQHALGLALSFGGGTNQTWISGTQEWQYQVGAASQHGLLAALLAREGVRAAPDSVEGKAGLLHVFVGEDIAASGIGASGGATKSDWHTLDVTFKPFPICALNQLPVTLLLEALSRERLRGVEVQALTIHLPPHEARYPGVDCRGPFDDFSARLMSAQYCAALALREGTVRLTNLLASGNLAAAAAAQDLRPRGRVARDGPVHPHAASARR